MKDYFSSNSAEYAKFRPTYPPELFEFLKQLDIPKQRAWDCGTGNGQVAGKLAEFFAEVKASDISKNQLEHAVQKSNISYALQPAEKTDFPDDFFDLVTVAQAIHWFDFEAFYHEVKRVMKPCGYIAVIGYGLFRSNPETNKIIDHFYREIVGPYWYPERKYLDKKYKSIPFPFKEVETPHFKSRENWSLERLLGYLNTWSSVKNYGRQKGENAVGLIEEELQQSFGAAGEVEFPILFRLGKV
ncbi:MAG: class I SAM-dependent methyltransferase [Salinimicrobium sp.]